MEYTRENIIKSLRACAEGTNCTGCVYYDNIWKMKQNGIDCEKELMRAAAAMLEEIGKGELPRKPEEVKAEPTMDELWVEHERLRGRANMLGGHLGVEAIPSYDNSPEREKEMKEELAYYEGFCDAAIVVIEAKQVNDSLPY